MQLKTIEANGVTYAEVRDGKPVFVNEAGTEIPFDVPAAMGKISSLNAESKSRREALEAATAKLKAYEGIPDAEAAIKALETIQNIDQGKLVAAGKVDEIKTQAQKAAEERVAAAAAAHRAEIDALKSSLDKTTAAYHNEMLGNAFANSAFIRDKIAIPADMIRATFGNAFKIEDGKIVAHDQSGSVIASQLKFGESAGFDEAIERLVMAYPSRDYILKGTGNSGGGARPGSDGKGSKTMSTDAFNKMPAKERSAFMADGGKLVD